jgi:Uma2 family endonuclease
MNHVGMLAFQQIEIDDSVKPAIEWIDGKAVQKLMPTDWHAFLQLAFAEHLKAWVKAQGMTGKVGTEWRFIISPNSYDTESLVPDVAYLSHYFELQKGDRKYPNIPPDIAVEILSPEDRATAVAKRRRFYLWWGVKLVMIVDPETRTVEAHEGEAGFKTFTEFDVLTSQSFPTLSVSLSEIFAELNEPENR